MTHKKRLIVLLSIFALYSPFTQSSYSQILKPLSRSQLKKFETDLFFQAKELQAGPLPKTMVEKGRELLDALIKKENPEQFEKSVERYFVRKLITEKQKDRFLKKNNLRKDFTVAAEAAKNHETKALVAIHKKLQYDLEQIEQDHDSKEEIAEKYRALKNYTALIGHLYTATFLATFINNPYELQVANELLSITYLLGTLASFITIDSRPKVALLKSFTDALQEVDALYNFIPENIKGPVKAIGLVAAAKPHVLPTLQKISAELETIPLQVI